MPNYNIVVNSKFKPFNYDELVKPIQQATEAHIALEDKFGELAEKASIWEEMANQETDPQAYKMYKKYANDLQAQADLLASEGLTPGSRKSLLGMKTRYSKEILPIEQAYARRKELADEQRKLRAQDGDLMFSTNYSTTSLDDLIKNPSAGYQSYSGKTLFDDSYKMASSIKQSMRTDERKWRRILGDDYYETVMQEGYSPEEILQVLSQDPRGSAVLSQIVEDVVNASGITSWGDDDIIERAYDYARKGLWGAAGKTQFTTLQNIKETDSGNSKKDDRADDTPIIRTGLKVFNGVDGGKHEDVSLIKGLKPTDSELGFSTDELDNIIPELESLENTINMKFTAEELEKYEEYDKQLEAYLSKNPNAWTVPQAPEGYRRYNNIMQKKKSLENKILRISELANKYSHLGDSNYKNVSRGVELAQMQHSQINSHIPLTTNNATYKEVREGVVNVLNSIDDEVINKGNEGTGVFSVDGTKIKGKNLQNIKDDESMTFKVTMGKEPQLQIVSDGKSYYIQGIDRIDNANKTLTTLNTFLSDYSKKTIESVPVTQISNDDYLQISKGILPRIPLTPVNYGNTGYLQSILYNPDSKDYIKILLTPDKHLVAYSTLEDELRGGYLRDKYINDAAINILLGLPSNVAPKP